MLKSKYMWLFIHYIKIDFNDIENHATMVGQRISCVLSENLMFFQPILWRPTIIPDINSNYK